MLDKVHPPAFEWPQIAGLAGALLLCYGTKHHALDLLLPITTFLPFYRVIGFFLILYSFAIIIMEKYFDLPFHYGRSQTGGSNANSVLIAALGIALFTRTIGQCILFGIIYCFLMMLLRRFIEHLRTRKEKIYLWMVGTATTDIANTGKAVLHNKTHKVCTGRTDIIVKGQSLTVIGIDGFRLFVVGK